MRATKIVRAHLDHRSVQNTFFPIGDLGFRETKEEGVGRVAGGEWSGHEQELGDTGEAATRGSRSCGLGRAQKRRALPRQHDRVRGQLELPARVHRLHFQGSSSDFQILWHLCIIGLFSFEVRNKLVAS